MPGEVHTEHLELNKSVLAFPKLYQMVLAYSRRKIEQNQYQFILYSTFITDSILAA